MNVVVAADREGGEFEQVDAAADTLRDVGIDVDAGDIHHELGVLVDLVVFVAAGEDGAELLQGVDVALSEGGVQLEDQVVLSVIHRNAAGDDLGAVGDVPVGAGLLGAEGVEQGIDVEVLEDALLTGGSRGDGVGREADGELHELGVRADVQGVQFGNQAEGGGTGGQAEGLVPDGADGQAGVRKAGQVVRPTHPDVFDREFNRIGVEE